MNEENPIDAKEVAHDTLNHLHDFSSHLIKLCEKLAEYEETNEEFEERFVKLIDGLETFVESIKAVRMVLKIGFLQKINVLEADLKSSLEDLYQARQKQDHSFVRELLSGDLPENLKHWRDTGLPILKEKKKA